MRTTLLLLATLGCAPVGVPEPTERAPVILVLVDNLSFDRIVVYVVTSDVSAFQIGQCDAANKCPMSVPSVIATQVRNTGRMTLAYRPLAGPRRTLYHIGTIPPPGLKEVVVAVIRNSSGQSYLSLRAAA